MSLRHHWRAEQLGEARANTANQVLDWSLAVRGAQNGRLQGGKEIELFVPDLRGAAAESSVGGQEGSGNGDVGHNVYSNERR